MSPQFLFDASPFFGLALTTASYGAAYAFWMRSGRSPLLHPIAVATVTVGACLLVLGLPYDLYASQTHPLTLGLGLIVVLLAVPLRRNWHSLVESRASCAAALATGAAVSVATALAQPLWTGAGKELLATLLPKAATAAVAVTISELLGGLANVTAVVVIATGVVGAVLGPAVLRTVGVHDDRAQGFALGVASHAIGTARALQISDRAGAFAALGMVLNAILTALAAPLLLPLLKV